MTTKTKIIGGMIIGLFLLTIVVNVGAVAVPEALPTDTVVHLLKGVNQSNEYKYYTASSSQATGFKQILSSNGALGSIIVASSSATTFKVWNATSTTDVSSTTVASLKASVGENTFTFDMAMERGIIIEIPTGWNGNYITTYRDF